MAPALTAPVVGSALAGLSSMEHGTRLTSSGFSLLETLVATTMLITVMAGLAGLLSRSVRLTDDAGRRLEALDAAQAKLEWLRARAWTVDTGGMPVTDASLSPSPPAALDRTTSGYSDWVDGTGRHVDDGGTFLRRWSIAPLDRLEPDAIAIEVCVFAPSARAASAAAAELCVATIRARQP